MKRHAILPLLAVMLSAGCEMLGDGSAGKDGELKISFDEMPPEDTRSAIEIPDTNDFLLYVADSKGTVVYEGTYGDAPESVFVKAGSYNIRALSGEITTPAFSSPQFGDEQCVLVEKGERAAVKLVCSQVNSGIRIKRTSGFLVSYPDASLVLKSSSGSLMYGYSEKRIAYFPSGNVSLILSQGGKDEVLMTRWLEPGEILSLGVSASSGGMGTAAGGSREISVAIDTSRVWTEESFVIGESDGRGESSDNPMGITQAMSSVGEHEVWVCGYIVGGDLSSSSASFDEPFTSRTNIVLGPKSVTTSRSSCLAVQLSSGSVRDNLNLVDNPEILGRRVALKGDVVASYYGLVGIKNVVDYVVE